jgi:Flp pilus assembly protein TadD
MSKSKNRDKVEITRRKPSRIYIIFVVTMAAFLVIGSIALVVGTALESRQSAAVDPDEGRPGEEIARLQTRVAENPEDPANMAVLANILANSGRLDESIVWYERATSLDPENGDLRLAFGLALFQLGNDFDAEIQLRRAQNLMPDSASPSFYLAQLYERRPVPDLDAAREHYRQAIEIAPDSLVGQQAQQRLEALESPAATPEP